MTSSLRRFVKGASRSERVASTGTAPAVPKPAPGELCELCGKPCGPEGTVTEPGHSHVINSETRSILCACRPCALLFTRDGAAGGRYRTVPDRFLHDPDFGMSAAQWDELQIPVRIAFMFRSSATDAWVTFYPSPAGATESLLPLDIWAEVMDAHPALSEPETDVEAVLVQRGSDENGDDGFEAFLVPITACYELVARIRMTWQGFDGGEEAHEQIEVFFEALRDRSELVG